MSGLPPMPSLRKRFHKVPLELSLKPMRAKIELILGRSRASDWEVATPPANRLASRAAKLKPEFDFAGSVDVTMTRPKRLLIPRSLQARPRETACVSSVILTT